MGWNTWREVARALSQQEDTLRWAARRFLNARLLLGLNTWLAWHQEVRRQQRMMAGAVHRLRNRALSRAWEQWQCVYQEMAWQQQLLRRAAMKMIHRKLSDAWGSWSLTLDQAKYQQDLLRLCQKHIASQWCKKWHQRMVYTRWFRRSKRCHSVPQFMLEMPPVAPIPDSPEYHLASWTRYREQHSTGQAGFRIPVRLLKTPRTLQPFEAMHMELSRPRRKSWVWEGELRLDRRARREQERQQQEKEQLWDWPRVPRTARGKR